jgi:predicted AlkP superfamily phosphohydrolase/phosphomutase
MKRVLIFGLDGATFDLIDPWRKAGYLPNINNLISNGSSGALLSTIPPVTAPAWTTFMTGVNLAKHGIFNFVRRKANSYNLEVTNASHISVPTFFEIASHFGKRVVSINVPYTSSNHNINGIIVGGPFAPAIKPEIIYPPQFFNELKQVVPEYFILPDYDSRNDDPLRDYADKILMEIDIREKLSAHLIVKEDWDVFMVVFMATDEIQHAFWDCMLIGDNDPLYRFRDVIRDVYCRADKAIGNLIDQASEDKMGRDLIVFIVSDHGAGPLRWVLNLNRYLYETGFLQFSSNVKSSLQKIKSSGYKTIVHAYRRYIPARFRLLFRSHLDIEKFEYLKGNLETTLLTNNIDWRHTKAYVLGAGGSIFINLRGREPEGIVEPGTEYEQVCQELMDSLVQIRDPDTNQPIVKTIYRRDQLFHGPHSDEAPDLIVEWLDYSIWGRGRYDIHAPIYEKHTHVDLSDIPLSSSHRPEGILIVNGKGIRKSEKIKGASLADLAPTILSQVDLPTPSYMDGSILFDMMTDEENNHINNFPPYTVNDQTKKCFHYTSEEEKMVIDRLRSLGYF